MSPVTAGPQFETTTHGISNLDRCKLCHAPRSVHGTDWACPAAPDLGGKRVVIVSCLAALLALAGIAFLTATSQTSMTRGTLAASACLTGITLLACALSIAGRRS